MQVSLQPLNAESFAPFGQVLSSPDNNVRENFAARVENGRSSAARTNLALIAAKPAQFPLEIGCLERHAFSNQAFMPLDVGEYLVVVCKDDGGGRPDLSTLHAFRVDGHAGVNYNPGTWHHGMTTIGAPGTFAMLVHEDGTADDCHFVDVERIVVNT
ncbi:MAG: ureidoglycolate lyase [Betaproteobacteria bacterium]